MTITDLAVDLAARPRRENLRHDLAELLERDVAMLDDDAHLKDDLCLDSLDMLTLLAWLETHGVVITSRAGQPARVGEVLTIVERAAFPGLTVRLGGRAGLSQAVAEALPRIIGGASNDSPLVPVLSNGATRLTPIENDDVRFLYKLAVHPETGYRWRYRGTPVPIERFVSDLWHQVLAQFVARQVEDDEPVGHVVAYGADMGSGTAYVGAVFQPAYSGSGLGAQAVQMFVKYLFHVYPLRKLYLEVPEFNWPQMSSGEGRLFTVEGRFREHEQYAGRYWDRIICAIYPEGARPGS